MGHHTYKDRCGGPYDPDLVQDVEDLVQSVKDDIVMQELGSMEIVRDGLQCGSVPRVGLQQLRKALEDVDMKDVDIESEVESEGVNLVGAQQEGEDTRYRESKTAAMTQPHQPAKNQPHPSEEKESGTKRSRRPRPITLEEFVSKEGTIEQSWRSQLFPDRMIIGEKTVIRHAASRGHGLKQPEPNARPFAHKRQWIPEDDIMEDCED